MIDHIDHIVLTTRDKDACIRFYTEILGMRLEKSARRPGSAWRSSSAPEDQPARMGQEFDPRRRAGAGSLDLCFIASASLEEVIGKLAGAGVQGNARSRDEDGSDRPIRSSTYATRPQSHRDLGSRSVITIWR